MSPAGEIILLPTHMPALRPVFDGSAGQLSYWRRRGQDLQQARVFRAAARQPEGLHLYGSDAHLRESQAKGLAIDIYV